jgi:hypothetical protein
MHSLHAARMPAVVSVYCMSWHALKEVAVVVKLQDVGPSPCLQLAPQGAVDVPLTRVGGGSAK